jgi:hypothetical protein
MPRVRFDVTWDQYRNSDPVQGSCLSTTILGLATNVQGLAGLSYQFQWGTTVPACAFGFQVSNKKNPVLTTSTDWTTLSTSLIQNYAAAGGVTGVGTAGTSLVTLGSLHAEWIRPVVTIVAGATAAASIYAYGCASEAGV